MKKKSILVLSLIIMLCICGCGKQQETKNDEIKLGEYEQMIFDYIVENDFYNQKEVRVAAANKLYGFKLSAFNKVGGNISKCYDFFKPNEYNTIIKEDDDCPNSLFSLDAEKKGDELYIDIKAINNSLKKHWEDMGY